MFVDWQSCSEHGGRAARSGARPVQGVLHRLQRACSTARRSPPAPTSGSIATSPSRAAGSRASRRSSARSGSRGPSASTAPPTRACAPAATFGGTLAAYERRLAEAQRDARASQRRGADPQRPADRQRAPLPQLAAGSQAEPAVHELVRRGQPRPLGRRRSGRDRRRWSCSARPNEEHDRARAGAHGQGLSASRFAYTVDDLVDGGRSVLMHDDRRRRRDRGRRRLGRPSDRRRADRRPPSASTTSRRSTSG